MRLLWLSPLHGESAIARFSELVLRALIKAGCDISVGSTEAEPSSSPPRPFLDHWTVPADIVADSDDYFDATIVNFGDHFPNHGRGLDALAHNRVIGIFHDADMINFGNGMRVTGTLTELLPSDNDGRSVTAAIAARCAGAVAHALHYRQIIDNSDGPVAVIPLAWSLPFGAASNEAGVGTDKAADETLRLVTFGNINTNKCADRVIKAIAGDGALARRIDYRLVGAIDADKQTRLAELADTSSVQLTVLGRVDDEALREELLRAHMISCLREPVLEGASASAIEAMLHGQAVLVSDAGFYADLPDDSVAKVPASTEPAAIGAALAELANDAKRRRALGERAKAHARIAFAPEHYARQLLDLIAAMRVSSAYAPTLDRVAGGLTSLGIGLDDPATAMVLRILEGTGPVARRTDQVEAPAAVSQDASS